MKSQKNSSQDLWFKDFLHAKSLPHAKGWKSPDAQPERTEAKVIRYELKCSKCDWTKPMGRGKPNKKCPKCGAEVEKKEPTLEIPHEST